MVDVLEHLCVCETTAVPVLVGEELSRACMGSLVRGELW